MPTPLWSRALEEVESRCKIKVAGKFIQGKAGRCTDHVEAASVPRSTRQVPRYLPTQVGSFARSRPRRSPLGSSSVTSSNAWTDPGPSAMRLSTWNVKQSHNS